MWGSLLLSDTECNINLSVCGIKEIGGLGCGSWSVVLGISTWTLIAAGVLFLEPLRSSDPRVLICCLLGQHMGESGHGATAASSCAASTVLETGAPGSSASYVRGGNYCLGSCKRSCVALGGWSWHLKELRSSLTEALMMCLNQHRCIMNSAQADFCTLLVWKGCYLLQRNWKKMAFQI